MFLGGGSAGGDTAWRAAGPVLTARNPPNTGKTGVNPLSNTSVTASETGRGDEGLFTSCQVLDRTQGVMRGRRGAGSPRGGPPPPPAPPGRRGGNEVSGIHPGGEGGGARYIIISCPLTPLNIQVSSPFSPVYRSECWPGGGRPP